MGAPPLLTIEQRRQALAKAALSRKERAAFKSEIRVGARNWREAFSDPREAIQKMRIKELLEAIPGFGKIRAGVILERAHISSSRRIQGIGRKQMELLTSLMAEK
jgi:guanylate kinase